MHPHYGAGFICGEGFKEVDGKKIMCLEIDTLFKSTKVFVPLESIKMAGLRKPLSRNKVKDIMVLLNSPKKILPKRHRTRIQQLEEKLKTGKSEDCTAIMRDLYERYIEGSLSMTERRIFEKVRNLLSSEVAIASNISLAKGREKINRELAKRKISSKK
jgi:RNA polymerase-interacting CarD/CdnL/TRCF family regulator